MHAFVNHVLTSEIELITRDLPKLAKKPPPPAVLSLSSSSNAAPNPSYIQLRSFAFRRTIGPDMPHRMTKGERVHGTGTTGVGGRGPDLGVLFERRTSMMISFPSRRLGGARGRLCTIDVGGECKLCTTICELIRTLTYIFAQVRNI